MKKFGIVAALLVIILSGCSNNSADSENKQTISNIETTISHTDQVESTNNISLKEFVIDPSYIFASSNRQNIIDNSDMYMISFIELDGFDEKAYDNYIEKCMDIFYRNFFSSKSDKQYYFTGYTSDNLHSISVQYHIGANSLTVSCNVTNEPLEDGVEPEPRNTVSLKNFVPDPSSIFNKIIKKSVSEESNRYSFSVSEFEGFNDAEYDMFVEKCIQQFSNVEWNGKDDKSYYFSCFSEDKQYRISVQYIIETGYFSVNCYSA